MTEEEEALSNAQESVEAEEASKVSIIKNLIIGQDKKELETQIMGMRELFTGILTENKKDYDRQVVDMKQMFADILEQNRAVMQTQLQDIAQALPKMIDKTIKSRPAEDVILLSSEPQKKGKDQVEKFSRMNAIKELIIGNAEHEIKDNIEETAKQLDKQIAESKQSLANFSQDIGRRLKESEEKLSRKLNEVCDSITILLQENERKTAKSVITSAMLKEVGEKLKQ